MKTFRLQTQLWLPQPRDKIFAFFADPRNLDRLTPEWLKFRIETADTSKIGCGARLDYRLRVHGIPIRWRSEISAWDPPNLFIDRQSKGPYALWIHRHTFVESDGGTIVGDDVEYAVPGGALVQKFLVAPDLARIFSYRHRVLEEIFNPSKRRAAAV
jgi:ligand-binding SRPBCC domain-containing protein